MQYTYVFYDPSSVEKFFLYVGNEDFYTVMETRRGLRKREMEDDDFDIYEELRKELHCYYSPLSITNIETGKMYPDTYLDFNYN